MPKFTGIRLNRLALVLVIVVGMYDALDSFYKAFTADNDTLQTMLIRSGLVTVAVAVLCWSVCELLGAAIQMSKDSEQRDERLLGITLQMHKHSDRHSELITNNIEPLLQDIEAELRRHHAAVESH